MLRHVALLPLLALSLAGCALSQSTEEVVLDYNKSFAKTRNEMLLINVLRSAAREPMQFSTLGQVQGSIGNGGQITIPFTNLLAGGKDIISPSLQITDSVNPNVTIIPLASKEFAEGILRPIRTDIIQLFLHNGWDPQFLLPLVVGGVVCPDGRLLHNGGEYLDDDGGRTTYDAFKRFFYRSAKTITISSSHISTPTRRTFTLTDKEAMTALKEGLGDNYRITQVEDLAEGRKKVTVENAKAAVIEGIDVASLCSELAGENPLPPGPKPDYSDLIGSVDVRVPTPDAELIPLPPCCGAKPLPAAKPGKLVFRSVASILHYLGESHRIRFRSSTVDRGGLTYFNAASEDQTLFKVDWGLSDGPRAVAVPFHGQTFHIPAIDLRAEEGTDRTLKTLSFLDQLIALQTNESAIRGAQSIFAITP